MQISELLAVKRLHLRFLTGAEHEHRTVRWACTTDLLEPERYLRGGELVLTGMMWHTRPEDSETFVASVIDAGAVAIGAGTALGEVPPDLIEACRAQDIPLIEVPTETSFGAVTEEVLRFLTRQRFSTLAESRDRHRRLMADVAAGADLPSAFAETATHVEMNAWLLSSTGRAIASSGTPLSTEEAEDLAARALSWSVFPHTTHTRGPEGVRTVTVVPVQSKGTHPLTNWLLVCAGDQQQWGEEERETVAELSSLAVLGRSRADERVLTEARHLEGLPRLLAAQRFGEATALLRGVDLVDGTEERTHAVVSAMMLPEPHATDLVRGVLAELVASRPGAVVTGDNDALAVIPVDGAGHRARTAVEELRADLVHRSHVLEGGLLDHRLVIGLSSAAPGGGRAARGHGRGQTRPSPGRVAWGTLPGHLGRGDRLPRAAPGVGAGGGAVLLPGSAAGPTHRLRPGTSLGAGVHTGAVPGPLGFLATLRRGDARARQHAALPYRPGRGTQWP